MRLSLFVAAVATLAGSSVNARNPIRTLGFRRPLPDDVHGGVPANLKIPKPTNPNVKLATFQQLIDHENPSLGTFSQSYWYNAEFYAGPGSPIVVSAPGEYPIDHDSVYTTNKTLPGVFAQTNGGAAIVLEHRYYGWSSPYQNLTTENLQYLTIDQAIQDIVYFANNVRLPFDPHRSSTPDKAPWILSGGSYPGTLTAWTHDFAPGTFWAYHATSAPLESIQDFWQYYAPVDEALPRNCSADFKRISAHVQDVLSTGTEHAKHHLKSKFGFGTLADDDFISAIMSLLGKWQEQQFFRDAGIFEFCDAVEGFLPKSNRTHDARPGADGIGLAQSLESYAKYWKDYLLPGPNGCGDNTTDCFSSHNVTSDDYTNTTVANEGDRQWMWILCNEALENWQVGSSESTVGYPPPMYTVDYYRRQCPIFFPEVNGHKVGLVKGRSASDVNRRTGGWSRTNTTRLIWVNGEYDPWRSLSVASDFRPGGPFVGNEDQPSYVIPKASHCPDLLMQNSAVNEGTKKVVDATIAKMKEWVQDFYKKKR
ncbi:hypothetical protein E4U55_003810 [Claviceps digitariae]|nr:hypothetical protein E4U55_003810 [Claviceps digitariae]